MKRETPKGSEESGKKKKVGRTRLKIVVVSEHNKPRKNKSRKTQRTIASHPTSTQCMQEGKWYNTKEKERTPEI